MGTESYPEWKARRRREVFEWAEAVVADGPEASGYQEYREAEQLLQYRALTERAHELAERASERAERICGPTPTPRPNLTLIQGNDDG